MERRRTARGSQAGPRPIRPPWAGQPHGLTLPRARQFRMKDGYAILSHMANQPFTEEFLSVKLCQWFVHDGFQVGYDFTDGVTSPEEELVHACMLAWENGNPAGTTPIGVERHLQFDLFRGHGGSPAEGQDAAGIRGEHGAGARARRPDDTFTAESDGYSLYNMMNRAGRMRPFDRAEPNGYPEDAPAGSAGNLSEHLRFVQSAMMPRAWTAGRYRRGHPHRSGRDCCNFIPPAASLRSAPAVADFFVRTLFPGEGAANLAGYRAIAVQFLDTADDGKTPPACRPDPRKFRLRPENPRTRRPSDDHPAVPGAMTARRFHAMNILSRRSFLSHASALGLGTAWPRCPMSHSCSNGRSPKEASVNPGPTDACKLLFIFLRGANDGLNTVAPWAIPPMPPVGPISD